MKNKLSIQYVSSDIIKEYGNNAKIHNAQQINQIAKSITLFGMTNPILLDKNNCIIAGHGRFLALKSLAYKKVPCVYIDHLNNDEVTAYRIADNKISENSTWDTSLLTIELKSLQEVDVNYDFDMLGFNSVEVDMLLHHPSSNVDEASETIPTPPKFPISQTGDIFYCGQHRVGCGDCRDESFMRKIMKRSMASILINDIPYNVPISGHVRGKGKNQFSEFAMACGEMNREEFTKFLVVCFFVQKRFSRDGALFYIFSDWRHLAELYSAANELFTQMINLCVWNKSNGALGSLYRSKHELVGVFKHGKAPHINNVQLGKFGRDRTNVWDYPGLSSFGKNRDEELSLHPTTKPVPLLKDILLDASKPNDIVIDGFLGSGSTLIAAEKTHRRCFGVEIDPHYIDVIMQRYLNETGNEPVHVESGLTFSQLSKRRSCAKGGAK